MFTFDIGIEMFDFIYLTSITIYFKTNSLSETELALRFQSIFCSILKTCNEIFLAFLPVETMTNILYLNINFAGNILLGFATC